MPKKFRTQFCAECIKDVQWLVGDDLRRIAKHPSNDHGFAPDSIAWSLFADGQMARGHAEFNPLHDFHTVDLHEGKWRARRMRSYRRRDELLTSDLLADIKHSIVMGWDFTKKHGSLKLPKELINNV